MNQVASAGSTAARILVVDDELHIVDFITVGLEHEGYLLRGAADGNQALAVAREWQPDLVILDVMLPRLDGLQVCRSLRAGSEVPILLLTARDTVPDRVAGLDSGADDYLCKPFSMAELSARVRALLRRRGLYAEPVLSYAGITLNASTREVWRDQTPIALTVREYELLLCFLRHPRQVLTRQMLLERVWGYDYEPDDNVVDVYVRYLRRKLGDMPPQLLHAVRGVGYVLRTSSQEATATGVASSIPIWPRSN